MKRLVLFFLILSAVPQDPPRDGDSGLVLQADFSSRIIDRHPPEGANAFEKASWHVYNQLTGRDFYDPANYMFFRQAVSQIGFIPAFFATADRILRDSKLGTADIHIDSIIHEGPEAYAPRK